MRSKYLFSVLLSVCLSVAPLSFWINSISLHTRLCRLPSPLPWDAAPQELSLWCHVGAQHRCTVVFSLPHLSRWLFRVFPVFHLCKAKDIFAYSLGHLWGGFYGMYSYRRSNVPLLIKLWADDIPWEFEEADVGGVRLWEILFDIISFSPLGLPWYLSSKEFAQNAEATGDVGSIPGSGKSTGGGHGNQLQYSFLENSMARGTWRVTAHGVTKSHTRLKQLST